MTETTYPCPSCGIACYFIAGADRFMHADGTASRDCWRDYHRNGAKYPAPSPVTARRLLTRHADLLSIVEHRAEDGSVDLCLRLDRVPGEWIENDLPIARANVTREVVDAMRHEGIGAYAPWHPVVRVEPSPSGVYFAKSGGYVKIGHSGDMVARIRDLGCGNPERLRILACVPEADKWRRKALESRYHQEWDELRVERTEWFRCTDRLNAWISHLVDMGQAFVPEPAS